jgi:anti-anti-sigma regulatory factor
MDCRIDIVQQADGRTVLLAGRLMAAQVHELCATCGALGQHVRVDLTDLLSADAVGVDALRRLHHRGAELIGVPAYFRQWLE